MPRLMADLVTITVRVACLCSHHNGTHSISLATNTFSTIAGSIVTYVSHTRLTLLVIVLCGIFTMPKVVVTGRVALDHFVVVEPPEATTYPQNINGFPSLVLH